MDKIITATVAVAVAAVAPAAALRRRAASRVGPQQSNQDSPDNSRSTSLRGGIVRQSSF